MEQVYQQTDGSTIAFAYLHTLKLRKKQFFVLRSVSRPSAWETQSTIPDSMKDYFLYAFKNEKHYQKRQPRRVYNMSGIILLTRCTKKDNRTVLGICFQEDALFLRFETEDELNRWYFHLSKIHSLKRNCRWPELTHCFSVLLKPKGLAAPASNGRHLGRPDLAGSYRLCLTDSTLLLVRDCLLNPTLTLPYRCIRSCVHSISASFFQIHLGRLSPIGEGVLHFEAEQLSMMKEIVEALMRCLNEASSHRLHQAAALSPAAPSEEPVKARPAGLNSRPRSKNVLNGLRQEIRHRASQLVRRSSAAVFNANRCNSASQQPLSSSQWSGAVGTGTLHCGLRSSSQPLSLMPNEAGEGEGDYLDLSGTVGSGPLRDAASQSPSSASSVSVCGAASLADCTTSDRASTVAAATAAALTSVGTTSSGSRNLAGRAGSLSGFGYGCQLQQPQHQHCILGQIQRVRQQSIPYGFNEGSRGGGGGHRDDRQLFVELSFPRPRTVSDAASPRWPRNRTGSHGNRSVCSGLLMCSSERMNSANHGDDDGGSYVLMGPGQSASTSKSLAAAGKAEEFDDGPLVADKDDPYWVMPSQLDERLKLRETEDLTSSE